MAPGDPNYTNPKRWSPTRRFSVDSRQISVDARRVSIDSRRFTHQPDPRRLSASYALRNMSINGRESPIHVNQFNVSLTPAPVDLDIEEAMEPKPRGFARHSSSVSMPIPVHLRDGGNADGKGLPLTPDDSELTLEEEKDLAFFVGTLDEDEDPRNFSMFKKCIIMLAVASGALCSTCASSMAAFAEPGTAVDLHVPKEVSILGVSTYVIGLAIGPLMVGPLSEIYGRNLVYRISYLVFFLFSFPVAFTPDIEVFLVFRFLTGFFSSAFLSVAAGSVSDIFTPAKTAIPMALYTLAPFIGPALGPLLSGFINQNTDWRWTYRVLAIWVFVELIFIVICIPETYHPVLMKMKAKKLRKVTKDNRYYASLDRREGSLMRAILISCYRPFELLLLDRMNLLLDLWCAILFGILYLTFQAFPVIFHKHNFSTEQIGMSFLGIGLGMLIGMIVNIWLIKYLARKAAGGLPSPEDCLLPSKIGALVVPASMYWIAFTTYPSIHWIVPIIASVFFGAGFILCFSGTFTYLVVAYRPMAASAMAANAFARSSFAAAFPLFAGQMYSRLGTVGATALLAGIMTLCAPLPFIFGAIGARLRAKSPFALH